MTAFMCIAAVQAGLSSQAGFVLAAAAVLGDFYVYCTVTIFFNKCYFKSKAGRLLL